ncbi:MAG: DoxX family protein [Rubripirellula sp.]
MRKFFLFPLRLCVGWGFSPRLLSLIGAVALVLLRLTVGWHFYSEGIDKRQAGNWSAAPFFANAKGPFAGEFRKMVWDADGQLRLNQNANMHAWAVFRDQVGAHYGFDDAQIRKAQVVYGDAVKQYEWVISENAAELEEFELGRSRIAKLESPLEQDSEKTLRDGVTSLGGQRDTIRKEWMGKAAPTLKQIDSIWNNYEIAQNALATAEQADSRGKLRLIKPRTARIDTSVVDGLLPYFDIAVGLLLLFGLFTPVAALAAAGFLGSVFLSQYPPSTGPSSSNYQLIESMACLVLAGTGAGRFAGLDFFLHLIVRKFWHVPDPDA